jgi:PAS domain S-box-containing protein
MQNMIKQINKKSLVIVSLFAFVYILLVFFFFHETKKLAISKAEENIAGFLLNHNAIQHYVEEIQKPEIYRLKNKGKLYKEYFSPIILSSSYITRYIVDALNKKRIEMGLNELHFKLASRNPRNPINQANNRELELLKRFNNNDIQEYKAIISQDNQDFLFYAIPYAANKESCMRCHDDPATAPVELITQYGSKAGFHDKIGEIRALISVRAPLNELLEEAHKTAFTLSAIAFALLSSILGTLLFFTHKLNVQQEELAKKSLYLENILRSSTTMAIVAIDLDLRVKYFNPEAERIFNYKADTILGKTIPEIHKVEDIILDQFDNAINQVKQHSIYRYSVEQETPAGIMYVDSQITGIWDHNNNLGGFVLMSRDVTEKQHQIQEKIQIELKLRRAQKMEAIGLMAGGVAHDLNNILSGIISYPELILMKLPKDSEFREHIKAIQESGKKAAKVVADLLTVARGAASIREPYDISSLIQECLDSPECKKLKSLYPNITYKLQVEITQPDIFCSPVHIKKCLINLLTNAAEAIVGDGTVVISCYNQTINDSAAEQSIKAKAGEYVVLSVSDTGPGISKEDLEHIFEPFYTTKKMGRSGTGLGLAVVWNTMQEHDGKILIDSSDRGTCFQLYFLVSKDAKRVPENSDKAVPAGEGASVLVVDDEAQLRDIASQMLMTLGYKIESVSSGELAIKCLENKRFDLIVIDMLMGAGMNGRQTYEKILAMHPNQKAIIVSGFSETDDVRETLRLGAGGFIQKPYSMNQLGRVARDVLTS